VREKWPAHRMVRAVWRTTRIILATLLLGAVLLFGIAGSMYAEVSPNQDTERLIVVLEEQPAAYNGNVGIRAGQDAVLDQILTALPDARLERRLNHALNALILRIPAPSAVELEQLRCVPGVWGVYSEDGYTLAKLQTSMAGVGATHRASSNRSLAAAGSGVRVAIIGDGIAAEHPMFDPTGLSYPSGYPKGDSRYTTAKVIASRVYLAPDRAPLTGEETPLPGVNGGSLATYCAGLIAGIGVVADYEGGTFELIGDASAARLLNYRVFYPAADGSEPLAHSTELLAAIDDAMADGAHVIYAPWAAVSERSPTTAPVALALQAAMDAGCIVVAPVGDDGPSESSASRLPAGMERVIAVGAVSGDNRVATDLVAVMVDQVPSAALSDWSFSRAEFGRAITETVGPLPVIDVEAISGSAYGCGSLPADSLSGAWALVSRGACEFSTKAYNVQQAGAAGLIVYNEDDTTIGMACGGGSYCEPGVISIPAVMVARTLGEGLAETLDDGSQVSLSLVSKAQQVAAAANVLLGSSARGPAYGTIVKPDLTAAGQGMLSAVNFRTSGSGPYALMEGTAVAGARVTAHVARLVEAHPTWDQAEIRSTLAQTALDQAVVEVGGTTASVMAQGAGVLAEQVSGGASVAFSPPLGTVLDAEPWIAQDVSLDVRDLRGWGTTRRWQVAIETSAGLTVSIPSEIVLAAGQGFAVPISATLLSGDRASDQEAHVFFTSGETTLHWPMWVRPALASQPAGILLIDNDFSNFENYVDYSPYVEDALDDLGLEYDIWDADLFYDQETSLPSVQDLRQYGTIIWMTGDHKHADGYYDLHTPLTSGDLDALGAYLDGSGRLLAIGQNLAEASDVNGNPDATWGRARFYHAYLGAHWVQGSVFGSEGQAVNPPQAVAAVMGAADTFLQGVSLNLGPVGDGEGNQVSIDEIGVGGLADGSDLDLVRPVLSVVGATPLAKGWLGVVKGDDPTIEEPAASIGYRSAYLSFGLEGVNTTPDTTTREELMGRLLAWLRDDVTVTMPANVLWAPNTPLSLGCAAGSSEGSEIVQYRWRVDGPEGVRWVSTEAPTLTLSCAIEGEYTLAVEARDALGHTAVAQTDLQIVRGGTSSLKARDEKAVIGSTVAYVLSLRNTMGSSMAFDANIPIPAGCQIYSSTAGRISGGRLRWQGALSPDEGSALELLLSVGPELDPGGSLLTSATIQFGGQGLVFETALPIREGVYMPAVIDAAID